MKKNKSNQKILINALSAQLGGGQTHILNIFKNDKNIWSNKEILFLTSDSNFHVFEKAFGKDKVFNVGKVGNNFLSRGIWENLNLSKFAKQHKVDIVFLAGGLAPFWMSKHCKWVAISHNLLPFSWKSIFQAHGLGLKIKLFIIRYAQLWTFQNVDGVIFTSVHAQKVISKFFRTKVKDIVIPSGIHPMFFEKKESGSINGPYILYVSTFFEYKHQKEVLLAFRKYKDEHPGTLKLVLIGNNSGSYGDECKKLVQVLKLQEYVVFKGNIPYNDLPSIMQHSVFNLFASDCENCPNILLEYLASASPILCSNFEPMPEFGKNFVTYYDPRNVDELALKMNLMAQNWISIIKQRWFPRNIN
jgi:glycosyltransferase involved in cell wall biosynthesis